MALIGKRRSPNVILTKSPRINVVTICSGIIMTEKIKSRISKILLTIIIVKFGDCSLTPNKAINLITRSSRILIVTHLAIYFLYCCLVQSDLQFLLINSYALVSVLAWLKVFDTLKVVIYSLLKDFFYIYPIYHSKAYKIHRFLVNYLIASCPMIIFY